MRHTARVATLALLAAACQAATDLATPPAERDGIRAVATRDSLVVTNLRAAPVFTFAAGVSRLALINWAACADASVCPPIPPGGTRATARGDLFLAPGEREVAVFWWQAGPRVDGVVRPDSIRGVGVTLP